MADLRAEKEAARLEATEQRERLRKTAQRAAHEFSSRRLADRALSFADPNFRMLERVKSGIERNPVAILLFMAGAYLVLSGVGATGRRHDTTRRRVARDNLVQRTPASSSRFNIVKEKANGNNKPVGDE